ncbi:lanthionine synthetase LanC family protein [Catellatospora coxensis]
MSTWCHGAPGIALSRLRAYRLYRDGTCRDEAVRGIATTRGMLSASLAGRTGNYSLCHGLGGNAEVLLHAADILGEPSHTALVRDVAEAGREHHDHPDRPWPCGTREGSTPGLMCGLAGIGLFYLRLHDPAVPSVLLLDPAAFARAA